MTLHYGLGGTAVAAALGEGAPALGGVLLDPTAIGRGASRLLQRITVAVMVIGADEEFRPARNRGQFYRLIPRAVGETRYEMRSTKMHNIRTGTRSAGSRPTPMTPKRRRSRS